MYLNQKEQNVASNGNKKSYRRRVKKSRPRRNRLVVISLIAFSLLVAFLYIESNGQSVERGAVKEAAASVPLSELTANAVQVDLPTPQILGETRLLAADDSLAYLAVREKRELGTLLSVNRISSVEQIVSGMEVFIPASDGILITTKKNRSVTELAQEYNVGEEELLYFNHLQSGNILQKGSVIFLPGGKLSNRVIEKILGKSLILPVKGQIVQKFGSYSDHKSGAIRESLGIQIAAEEPSPLTAIADGLVVAAGYNEEKGYFIEIEEFVENKRTIYPFLVAEEDSPRRGDTIERGSRLGVMATPVHAVKTGVVSTTGQEASYGNYMAIKHKDGSESFYGFLGSYCVEEGDTVNQGDVIGSVDKNYRSGTPRLHFSYLNREGGLENPESHIF